MRMDEDEFKLRYRLSFDSFMDLVRKLKPDLSVKSEAQARLEAQWPLERKRPLADVVINNRNSAEELINQLNRYAPPSPGTTL